MPHFPSRRRLLVRLRRVSRNDQFLLIGFAMVLGLAAGGASIGFREAIGGVQWAAFGTGAERLHEFAATLPWWQILLAPTAGGLLVGIYIHRFLGGTPRAVAQVMEASAVGGGRMSLKDGLHAAVASALSLGVGGSAGREGPVVHLGASVGAWISERLHLNRGLSRTLLACGVAAAVAASFNAPLAGVFFALEVVIGHYALSAFAPIVVSSVVATMVSRAYYGAFPAFIIPNYSLAHVSEFAAFALLGVVVALLAIAFMRSVALVQDTAARMPVPSWSRPAFGGLLVGAIAIFVPEVLGVGYGPTDNALNAQYTLAMLLVLTVAKTTATAITLGSGFGGGVFSPSLFLGATMGGAFGAIAGSVAPDLYAGHGAYAIVGMGAMAGAVLGAPISTILIIFELTGDYELTVAVMVGTVTAALVTRQLHGASYFRWMLAREGIDVERRYEIDAMRAIRVGAVMSREFVSVPRALPLPDLRLRLANAPYGELFVVDDNGRLFGTITLADMREAAFDPALDQLVVAGDAARLHPPVLSMNDDIEQALTLMEDWQEEHIPVVESRESRRLVGFVHERDVMQAYNRALVAMHRADGSAY